MYRDTDVISEPMSAWEQVKKYGEFVSRFSFNEFRAGWGLGGKPLVMRLSDKNHSWDVNGLNMLLPNSLIQVLIVVVYHCPDMIGGWRRGGMCWWLNKGFHIDNYKAPSRLHLLPLRLLSKPFFAFDQIINQNRISCLSFY